MDPKVLKGLLSLGYGENVEIPYGDLKIPEEFQRELRPRNWDEFVPALFGRAVVVELLEGGLPESLTPGDKVTVDGIHRVEEGHSHGMWTEHDVPSVLYQGTYEQAAGLYHLANIRRVALAAADSFRGACFSGDEDMQALDADLLDIGLDGWCMGRADRDCTAIGTVIALTEKYGREHTLYVLDVISECWSWRDDQEETYAASSPHVRVIKGFGEYLRPEKRIGHRRYPRRWDPENAPMLTAYIATTYGGQEGLLNFLARAATLRAAGGGGGMAAAVEEHVHKCFLAARREMRAAADEAAA